MANIGLLQHYFTSFTLGSLEFATGSFLRLSLGSFRVTLLNLSFRADPIAATPIKELPGRFIILLGHMEITRNDRFTGRRPMPRLKRATSEVVSQGAPLSSPSHLFAICRSGLSRTRDCKELRKEVVQAPNVAKSDPFQPASIISACTLLCDTQDTLRILNRRTKATRRSRRRLSRSPTLVIHPSSSPRRCKSHPSDRPEHHPGSHSRSLGP
jgi:hypothetical protein